MEYMMTVIINGEIETTNKLVDQDFYNKYTCLDTLKWFRSMGGKETLTHLEDHTLLRSVSPDKTTKKSVMFYPVNPKL
jgi:hypothetical protein